MGFVLGKARFSTNLKQIHKVDIQYQPKMKKTYHGVSKQGNKNKTKFSRKQQILETEMSQVFLLLVPKPLLTLEDHVTILVYRQTNISNDNLVWARPTQKKRVKGV